ncbi:MAG: Fe(3+)-hydroxamate ABC transporter permease FhuB [Gemmatimonadota bacterium]
MRDESGTGPITPARVVAAVGIAALAVSLVELTGRLPVRHWPGALLSPEAGDMRQALVHHSWLPRVVTSLLAGAALALAGAVFQQVLRNPIASPATLGIAAGSRLALAVATLWAPGLLVLGREWVALAGGAVTLAAVMAIAWRKGLSPLAVVLAGLVMSLYFGAVAAVLVLMNDHHLNSLFIWGAGSLSQQSWETVTYLAPRLAVVGGLMWFMRRPLTLLGLDDEVSSGLGLSLHGARLGALALAVALTAFVVSAVGVIGFIGLAAPAMVHLIGARRLRDRLVWAPLLGAGLLWLTDQLVLQASGSGGELLPTGAVTALFGSPLLLWLLPRLKFAPDPTRLETRGEVPRSGRPGWLLTGLVLAVPLLLLLVVALGQGPAGWTWSWGGELEALLPWRAPRAIAALAAGAMLAVAGVIMQRLTGNPMASPEILGISAGAALGMIVALFVLDDAGRGVQLTSATVGAFAALLAVLAMGRKTHYAPGRILLAGIALSAFFDALVVALMATGDPRATLLLNWMMGSTAGVDAASAAVTGGLAVVLLAAAPLCRRWLEVLPLGATVSRSLGVDLDRSRLGLLGLTAALTAAGTLVVGPLSFVGLMAPHLARRLGLQRALPELAGAALVGALVMLGADWLGRSLLSPWQIPAGLFAILVGGPVLMWLLRRS